MKSFSQFARVILRAPLVISVLFSLTLAACGVVAGAPPEEESSGHGGDGSSGY